MSITFKSILVTHPKPTYSYILQHPNVSLLLNINALHIFQIFLAFIILLVGKVFEIKKNLNEN